MKLTKANTDFTSLFSAKYVFNPTVGTTHRGETVMICRLQDHEREGALGLVLLDEKLNVSGSVNIIKDSPAGTPGVMLEDPRFVRLSDGDYVAYIESSPTRLFTTYVVLAKLVGLDLQNAVVPAYKKNKDAHRRLMNSTGGGSLPSKDWIIEKNWQFFTSGQKNYCIYKADHEHDVFGFDITSGAVMKQYKTLFRAAWKHGKISGGASPVLHSDGLFYSFFHSWTVDENKKRTYHIGVYTFENKPPFRVKEVSSQPIISATDPSGESPSQHAVVFPSGALYHVSNAEWIVATGLNDNACGWLTISHSEARSTLKKVRDVGTYGRLLYRAFEKLTRYLEKRRATLFGA
jgi:predicted GH43/DUF377 family glycosyl hydrolase